MSTYFRQFKIFLNTAILICALLIIFFYFNLLNQTEDSNYSDKYKFPVIYQQYCGGNLELWIGDLDNNGNDEYIVSGKMNADSDQDFFEIYENYGGQLLKKRTFPERLVPSTLVSDINFDGDLEILLPFCTQDSLMLRIMNYVGNDIRTIPLLPLDISPQQTPQFVSVVISGSVQTEIDTLLVYRLAISNEAGTELTLCVSTLRGQLVWKKGFASFLSQVFLSDVNGDGQKEIVCISNNWSRNVTVASEYKESIGYLIVFDIKGEELWHQQYSDSRVNLLALVEDIRPDIPGDEILLAVTCKDPQHWIGNDLLLIDGKNNILQSRRYTDQILKLYSFDYNNDQKEEYFIASRDNKLRVLNANFKTLVEKDVTFARQSRVHIDTATFASHKNCFLIYSGVLLALFDTKLNVITTKKLNGYPYFFRVDKNRAPIICVHDESNKLIFIRSQRNLNYYFFRSRYIVIGLLCGLLLVRLSLLYDNNGKQISLERLLRLAIYKDFDFGLGVFDQKGHLTLVNDKMKDIFNRDFNSLLGKHYEEIFSIINPAMKNLLDDVYENHFTDLVREIPHRLIDKEREIKVVLHRIDQSYDPLLPSTFVFWIADDITELIKSKRLGAWLSLAQRYAHDVKTPLSTIYLTVQRIEMELEKDQILNKQRYYHYLDYMKDEVGRIRKVTNGFLKFVRAEKINKVPVDFNHFIQRIVKLYEQRLPKGISLQLKLREDPASILLDEEQFQIVLENLLDNAINAISEPGSITITSDVIEELDGDGMRIKHQLLIEIADTGCGIPEKNLNQVFQPFYSSSPNGSGLGLMIVRHIVEEHGGTIFIRSQPGIGTVVIVKLPA